MSRRCLCESRGASILRSRREDLAGRDYLLLDVDPGEEFRRFWGFLPSFELSKRAKATRLIPGKLGRELQDIDCDMMHVDHSVKGACAFSVKTTRGNVVYTGDIRMHGLKGDNTREFVAKVRSEGAYALVIEGTRAGREDVGASPVHSNATEEEVKESADGILAGATGELVIADFGPRNVERLEIFLDLASRSHRKLVVTAKDAYLLYAMHTVDRSVPVPGDGLHIYDSPKGSTDKYEEWVVEHEYPDALVKPGEVNSSPGDHLLSFSFFDIKHLIDIRPSGGRYIYSSSEAHNEEQVIDFVRLSEWLKRFGLKPHGFRMGDDGRPSFVSEDGPLHASGHASASDLVNIVREIKPEVLVPVHTEDPDWYVRTFGDEFRVVLPEQYRPVTL